MTERMVIPSQLRRPHPVVVRTREWYADVRPDEDGRMRPRPVAGVARLIVSKKGLRRALLVLQAVFAEAERRGWSVEPDSWSPPGVAIEVRGHSYAVSVHELHERVPMTAADVESWRREHEWRLRWNPETKVPTQRSVPNGFMKLSLPSTWQGDRSSWSEGPRGPLDRKLPQFFAELERRAAADDVRAEQRRRAEEQRQRELALRRERDRLQAIEAERAERLLGEVERWRRSADVRAYVAALHAGLDQMDLQTRNRVLAWCAWASRWADENDPVLAPAAVAGLETEDENTTTDPLSWPR